MTYQDDLSIRTTGHGVMHDITSQVEDIVTRSQIQTGIVHVFNIGSTATIGTIEFEPGLRGDYPEMLDRLIPPSRNYGHEQAWHDGNGHSHLQASLAGPSVTIPIRDGQMVLGTWQQIIYVDFDNRPRQREFILQAIGE